MELEGPIAAMLRSPNPEVVLSVPDLYAAAREAHDAAINAAVATALHADDYEAAQAANEGWQAPEREVLKEGAWVRERFLRALDYFFAYRHHEDAKTESGARRAYLERELAWLAPGDAVITTNWDTLVERILAVGRSAGMRSGDMDRR